jgi:hypothetical protein
VHGREERRALCIYRKLRTDHPISDSLGRYACFTAQAERGETGEEKHTKKRKGKIGKRKNKIKTKNKKRKRKQ